MLLLYESDNGSASAAATSTSTNSTASKGYGIFGYSTSVSDVIWSKKVDVNDDRKKLALAKSVVEEKVAQAGMAAETYEARLKKVSPNLRTGIPGTPNFTTKQDVDAFFSNTANAGQITNAATREPIITFSFGSSGWYQYTGADSYARFSNLLSAGFMVYPNPSNENLTIQLTYEAGTVRADPGTYNHFVALTGGYKF